jgi:hypothetical protein
MAGRPALFPNKQRLRAEGRAEPGFRLLMSDIRALNVRRALAETTCFATGTFHTGFNEFTLKNKATPAMRQWVRVLPNGGAANPDYGRSRNGNLARFVLVVAAGWVTMVITAR